MLRRTWQCESRCAAAEAELRTQRGAAERRLAAVEREVGESVNVRANPRRWRRRFWLLADAGLRVQALADRTHEKIGESATRYEILTEI